MRVLLFGAGGMLGRALQEQTPGGIQVTARERSHVDVRDAAAMERAIEDVQPACVVNASAYTDVDAAESDRETAFAVNATAVGHLAASCARRRLPLMHFSSDYVFDGSKEGFYDENDTPSPLSVYGASKLAGEELVRSSGAAYAIVRTQWLFGPGGKSFVASMLDRALTRQQTRAASDQVGCVTYTADLATTSWSILLQRLTGTFHVANRGRVSRYDLARRIFEALGVAELLTPGRTADFPAAARRPVSSPMSVRKVERALGTTMPEWTDALQRYLAKYAMKTA